MGVMKLAVENTSDRPWDGVQEGTAKVIEACCYGIPVGTSFAIQRKHRAALYVGLKQEYDDAADVPLMYCPSCGASVEVVSWESARNYERDATYSGDVNLATGLPPGCQWSGQAGTYGTLPNDGREGGPA